MNESGTEDNEFEGFKEELRIIREVDNLPESDEQLRQLMTNQRAVFKHETLKKDRSASLIHSRRQQDQRRMNNRLKILRWLTAHRHSRLTILAHVLAMGIEGARKLCNNMVRDKLIIKHFLGYNGRPEFMLYGITTHGLDLYYAHTDPDRLDQRRSKRIFRITDGLQTTLFHDHALQWVQLHLEAIDYPGKPHQYWVSDHALPHYAGLGKQKQTDAWHTYPDGILYNSPYSWRHTHDVPEEYRRNTVQMTNHLTDEHWLAKNGISGDYGYLDLAIEIEKTNKTTDRYRQLMSAHETNIEAGRYDAVLYLLKNQKRALKCANKFEQLAKSNHHHNQHYPHTQTDADRPFPEPQWKKTLRKFIFDSYDRYVDLE